MKNFRKVLALVLVVATLFSFTAMASAKSLSDYKDVDKISYDEAVAVLSAVGILDGYEDDTFKPTNNISREEMAKMIAVLSNAGSDVSTLYAPACTFADVAKDRWSASYVAYCAKTGIVAGRSTTTFDPKANVTGLETAKMLLVVLGFNAEKQGYVGSDWKLNVLRDAKVMGLLENFADGYNPENNITREEAAQMMLNALEAPCVVGFLNKNSSITLTNALLTGYEERDEGNGEFLAVTTYAKLKDAVKAGKWCLYGDVVISDDILAEKLFGLTKNTTTTADCFGRPSTGWSWVVKGKTTEITIAASSPVKVYTSTSTTAADFGAYLNADADKQYTIKLFINGQPQWGNGYTLAAGHLTNIDELSGKGVRTEVYVQGNVITVVMINTLLTTISGINTYNGTFTLTGDNTAYANKFGFGIGDVGEVVWAVKCADGLHSCKLAEVTEVSVKTATAIKAGVGNHDAAKSYFETTDGKKYEYAKYFGQAQTVLIGQHLIVGEPEAPGAGAKLYLFVDEYGYVRAYDVVNVAPEYAIVVDGTLYAGPAYTLEGAEAHDYTADLRAYVAGCTLTEDVKLKTAGDYNAILNSGVAARDCDTLIEYKAGSKITNVVAATIVDGSAGNIYLNAGSGVITGLAKGATNSTKYIIRTFDAETAEFTYTYLEGKAAVTKNYKAESIQYFADGDWLTYVYVDAAYVQQKNTAFILDETYDQQTITVGGVVHSYTGYTALVGGEKAFVATTERGLTAKRLYTSNYVSLGYKTADGLPIYKAFTEMERLGTPSDFQIVDGLMTYVDKNGQKVFVETAEDALLVVAFANGWDDDHNPATAKVDYKVCDSINEVMEYARAFGWTNGRDAAYIINNAAGEVAEMYLVMKTPNP